MKFKSQKRKKYLILFYQKKTINSRIKKKYEVKKSKYYSKKDFSLAKKAISEMKQAKWPRCIKNCKKS